MLRVTGRRLSSSLSWRSSPTASTFLSRNPLNGCEDSSSPTDPRSGFVSQSLLHDAIRGNGSSGMSTEYGGASYSSNGSPYHRPLGPHCCHNGGCFLWDMLQCDVLSPHICRNRYVRSRVCHGTLTFKIIRWLSRPILRIWPHIA